MKDQFLTLMLPLVAGSSLLGACSRGPTAAAHTVNWYLAHTADRASMVERCANDPGTLEKTPDCINAFAAAQRADIGSLKNLPPMGLPQGAAKAHSSERPSENR